MTAKELREWLQHLADDTEILIGTVDNYGDEIEPRERHRITSGIGGTGVYVLCFPRG